MKGIGITIAVGIERWFMTHCTVCFSCVLIGSQTQKMWLCYCLVCSTWYFELVPDTLNYWIWDCQHVKDVAYIEAWVFMALLSFTTSEMICQGGGFNTTHIQKWDFKTLSLNPPPCVHKGKWRDKIPSVFRCRDNIPFPMQSVKELFFSFPLHLLFVHMDVLFRPPVD